MINKEYIEIELNDFEEDQLIGKEIIFFLRNGEQYSGTIKDLDDEEIVLSKIESEVSLGFQLDWITQFFISKHDYEELIK